MEISYKRLRDELDLKFPGMTDRAASMLFTDGKYGDLLRNMKRGRTKIPDMQYVARMSKVLDRPVEWLTEGKNSASNPHGAINIHNAEISGEIKAPGHKVKLFGSAVGGVHGEFVLNGSHLDDIYGPPSLAGNDEAYAVMVAGESMLPRYEDGETAFADPKRRVKRDDYVVAQIKMEENGPILAFVKKFIKRNSDELVLEQLNPAKELRFRDNTVVAVHYILRGGE